ERLARYDAETRAMPRYIRTIRSWQLATTCEATGSRPWTHVWEQEYEDLAGLTGAYMMHPFHWAHIDRWYDPESPHWLVDPYVCHGFCATRAPVIDTAVDAVDGVARRVVRRPPAGKRRDMRLRGRARRDGRTDRAGGRPGAHAQFIDTGEQPEESWPMTDWNGRVCVVTGAGSGIGGGLARRAASLGMHVFA